MRFAVLADTHRPQHPPGHSEAQAIGLQRGLHQDRGRHHRGRRRLRLHGPPPPALRERRLPDSSWILTPGSLKMYDFGERPEKGLYIIDNMLQDDRRQHAVLQRLSNLVDRDTSAYDEYLDLFQKYMASLP